LLSEVDIGLGRSGNRNVARELDEAVGMSYAFGVSYLALTDDFGDDAAGVENTLALSGTPSSPEPPEPCRPCRIGIG
jgi:hypothetical protein